MKLIQLSRVFAVALLTACAVPIFAQPAQPADPNAPAQPAQPAQPGGRPRGNFDPTQFRQQMMDRMKEQLGASDDEWAALSPKVQKVMDTQRATRTGGGFGGRQRGGNNNQPTATATTTPPNPVADATKALSDALNNKETKPEELKAKLTALRDARAKAKDELTAAQKDLQALLTQRQEALLVQMGLLE